MGDVYFYHLTERPIEATLPVLLDKAMGAGWRIALRGRDAARLEALDRQLWMGEGFLPHGVAGGPHDADQPILLTTGAVPDDAQCLMTLDGAEVTPEEALRLTRTCILFNGADEGAVEAARAQWRSLTGGGLKAKYWAEEDGRWTMKAESG
ncbi:DNA polymerase III subunit chi [Alphaproteobacteria bacterium GH1-50]|uniref:DNA polymerase III subunit chi n=1 Tax=Kangsaoukella pontilimi TaxID=2691042 RepID=A0A7C9MF51_9RHOB|nr:DNA polymerase III subunit chi [Kangsaoukella pontilimi]MXQ07536.1 DNA polymerase III subunit chi [Kangsaoukella pontilimi]